nr:Wilms tumor protein 1-interacting protein-like [Vulpes vulpes]
MIILGEVRRPPTSTYKGLLYSRALSQETCQCADLHPTLSRLPVQPALCGNTPEFSWAGRTGGSHKSAPRRGGSGREPLRRRRAQGRRRRTGDCSTVPEAGREPAELGEEPPRPRAEHAAPACSARVHPAQRGGDRAEAVAPGRCLGPDPLHVSPARSHVHRLSPVRRPDVLRINKMKLRATGGQIAPGPPNPRPRQNDLPTTAVSRRSPSARPEPAGQVAALARPRPPAPPHRPGGALPQSLIKKVAKLTLPKVVVACAPLSLPAMYSLKQD